VSDAPLVLGTAGHVDHGKTRLVGALTGVDTDRLPQERERGVSIELGYAPLGLPSGRRLSVVDVPGHERFVRTMVAGATGIDLFLMVVAADDGVMPQTREHAAVLAALGVTRGVVAVTKSDVADPAAAIAQAAELLPGAEAVPCSGRTGEGVAEVAAALDRVAAQLPGRAHAGGPPVLHVDRAFTIKGAGTVVTGTLWSGAVARGDDVTVLPRGRSARVRGVQVHDAARERAEAGQRVALNLAGLDVGEVHRGDVVTAAGAITPTYRLDVAAAVGAAEPGDRVHVHHGTREAPARIAQLGSGFWQLRLEQPLLARRGDRVVLRAVAPPDTLGGGVVLDAGPRKHGASPELVARLERLAAGEDPGPEAPEAPRRAGAAVGTPAGDDPPALTAAALAVEGRLRDAGHEPPSEADLGIDAEHLPALAGAGRAVRVGRTLWAHPDALAAVHDRVIAIVESEGSITLARLRDELGTSRRFAQAHLEHLDGEHVLLRRPDDSRVLRRRRSA
jgi:selenocysteine-specific elongation factor